MAPKQGQAATLKVMELSIDEIKALHPGFQPLIASGNLGLLRKKLEADKNDLAAVEACIGILKSDVWLPGVPKKADLLKAFEKQKKKIEKKAKK